jgi:hypothetical protein
MIEKIINKKVEDIIVSGYSEKHQNFYNFSPMLWWIYVKFKNSYIVFSSNDGNILIEEHLEIICNFDIEEDDLFTISSLSKKEYGIVSLVDLIYDDFKNLIKIGILFSEESEYILFDSLDFEGFLIEYTNRDVVLENLKKEQLKTLTK